MFMYWATLLAIECVLTTLAVVKSFDSEGSDDSAGGAS